MSEFGFFNPQGVVCGRCDTVLTMENMSRRISDDTIKEIETSNHFVLLVYEIMCSRCAGEVDDRT